MDNVDPPAEQAGESAAPSTGLNIGPNSQVDSIVVQGPVVGRDLITITENLTHDVSDIASNPYLGLASFTYDTRAYYGGRDRQIREAVDLLTAPGGEVVLAFITGASGSGKSSFAQAGVLPALESFYAQAGRKLRWSVLRPGRHPLAALGQALSRLGLSEPSDGDFGTALRQTPPDQVNVLILDQFEELFTQSDPSERDAVTALLGQLPAFQQIRTLILVTLRADYLPSLFGVPPLFNVAKRDGIELRAMSSTELAQAIRRPLDVLNSQLKVARSWEPSLVERLVEDVGSESALLPLLQVTLTSLWNDPPRRLTLDRYRNLTAALESTAERVYGTDRLGHARSDDERQATLGIFLDLVEVSLDDDARRDVRRTVDKAELLRDHPERAPLVDELVSARLLAASSEHGDDATIDIIHETLLANWPRLRDAIADQREALQSRERFRLAMHEWLEHAQSDEYLLQGVRLAEARDLVSRRDIAMGDANARAFLSRSATVAEEARQRELEQAHALAAEQHARAEDSLRAARRLRLWLVVAVTAAVLAVVGAVLAVSASMAADRQSRINASRELAAQSAAQLTIDPELSILLAREGELRMPTQQSADALRTAMASSPARLALLGPGSALGALAIAPDGKTFAAADADGGVHIWAADSGRLVFEILAHSGPLTALAFNQDGSRFLTASSVDPDARTWDARSGAPLGSLRNVTGDGVSKAALSHDGRWIVTASTDGSAQLWDAASTRVIAPLTGHAAAVTALVFSPDDSHLLSASLDGSTRLWTIGSTPSSVSLAPSAAPITNAAFDHAGRRLVTAAVDGSARIWDGASGAPLTQLATPSGPLTSVSFSPDDRRVLTAGLDGVLRLWDAASGQSVNELRGHTGPLAVAGFDRDGSHVLSASYDGTARIWNAADPSDFVVLRGHTRELADAEFSPDGRSVVTTSLDGTARTWSVEHTQPWSTLRGHARRTYTLAFSPDGQRLASGGIDTTLRLWSLPSARALSVQTMPMAVTSVSFSPDGQRLAFGLVDGSAAITSADDPVTEAQVALRGLSGGVHTLDFSPDGSRALTASGDGSARVWNAASGEPLGQLSTPPGDVFSALFDTDGRRIATASADGTARVWDAASLQPLADFRGHSGPVYRAAFSPDGRTLATAGDDKTVRIWQADNGQSMKVLAGHAGPVYGVTFSRDGGLLVSVSADHSAIVWDTSNWERLTSLPGESGEVLHAAFSRDGRQLATAGDDGLIRIYPREFFSRAQDLLELVPSRVTRQPAELTPAERGKYVSD